MNKISKIENIKINELLELTESLVKKQGYFNIEIKEHNFLTAQIKKGFETTITGFWLTKKRLSGNIEDWSDIITEVKEYVTKYQLKDLIVVSNKFISKGKENKFKESFDLNFTFLNRDSLIELIDDNLENYWSHNDIELLEYEKHYITNIANENELRNLRGLHKDSSKLLDFYINPRLYKIEEDKESDQPQFVRYDDSKILEVNSPSIIVGDAGSGKSTFLRKIGELCLKSPGLGRKRLPVFISTIDLIEAGFDLEKAINKNLNGFFNSKWESAHKTHDIILLVDSIDEFEQNIQLDILNRLQYLYESFSIKYYLATRSLENNIFRLSNKELEYFQLQRFNSQQIRAFVSKFFQSETRAQELVDALSQNRILERLPMTPLSISLISILFEEKNFEIPATISDIYDNFNLLLLGKTTVSHRFEFVDVNFKERLLSLYALQVMKSENKTPLLKEDFLQHFKDYFKDKSHSIPDGKIEEFLEYFVSNTGVLYLKDRRYVCFKHDSFMEYYAALEIFKHRRDLEADLIDNFYDLNWQNSAIFYAGKSKDMKLFLEKIISKVEKGHSLIEYNLGIMGLGYLLQALYQTDNIVRKKAILVALSKSIEALETYKKIASDKQLMPFKDLKLPILSALNLLFFIENFNSITLRDPLKMAFEEEFISFKDNPENITNGYKALKLALLLNSKRINSDQEMESLLYESNLLTNPYLTLIADLGITLYKGENYSIFKKDLKKALKSNSEINRTLLTLPANTLRFTPLDQISTNKKIKIFTEGKTDAEIIEHAFITLTGGKSPYWSIRPAGSASELRFLLEKGIPIFEKDEIAIGVFDNDSAGISEFDGLKSHLFGLIGGSKRIKKGVNNSIYALKLPVPNFRSGYLNEDKEYNYFAIEHYFNDEILKENNLLESTPLSGLYKIKQSNRVKSNFSLYIRTIHQPAFFNNIKLLFEEIDKITGVEGIEYLE